jgi:hypothetical protein
MLSNGLSCLTGRVAHSPRCLYAGRAIQRAEKSTGQVIHSLSSPQAELSTVRVFNGPSYQRSEWFTCCVVYFTGQIVHDPSCPAPTKRSWSKLYVGMRDYLLSKPVWKRESKTKHETNHSTHRTLVTGNRKQGHRGDCRICKIMTLNEIHCNHVASTYLSIVCFILKTSYTQNTFLSIESTGR